MNSESVFLSAPIIWFIIGVAFMLLEFVLPGLIVVFFGIGAWVTAIFTYMFDLQIEIQLISFIGASILSLLLLRRYFKKIFVGKNDSSDDELEEYIGKTAIAEADFGKEKTGRIIFKGAGWTAFSEFEIKKGENVRIVGKDSIKLKVEPIKTN